MKTINLKNKKIDIRTEVEELTYTELIAFKQYFSKVIYDIDESNIDEKFQEIKNAFNKAQYADMWLIFYNWYIGLKTQEPGGNAWILCFGLLIEKEKPTTTEKTLIETVQELETDGLNMKTIIESVEVFSQAFPLIWSSYQLRVERLIEPMLKQLRLD